MTDCTLAGGFVTTTSTWTQINLPKSDVILTCALTQLGTTSGTRIIAHSILVDGNNGGSVGASGTSGIQLIAGSGSGSVCDASATVDLEHTTVIGTNSNGNVKVDACGDIVANSSTISSPHALTEVRSSGGRVCLTSDTISGDTVLLEASSDLTMHGTTVTGTSPTDFIRVISDHGSVFAGGGNPDCGPGNSFLGSIESSLSVTAAQLIDLTNACIEIAENITITAGGAGFNCASDIIINLKGAEVRNDFGKPGFIAVSACSNLGRIDITDAVLVDTGGSGGGIDPNAVASLNGGKVTGPCPIGTPQPNCASGPISTTDNPVCADETDRQTNHHVTGTPKVDR